MEVTTIVEKAEQRSNFNDHMKNRMILKLILDHSLLMECLIGQIVLLELSPFLFSPYHTSMWLVSQSWSRRFKSLSVWLGLYDAKEYIFIKSYESPCPDFIHSSILINTIVTSFRLPRSLHCSCYFQWWFTAVAVTRYFISRMVEGRNCHIIGIYKPFI